MACLLAAVSLLLLEALFMQISVVSLALHWPCRLCLIRVLLCASHCYKLSPFQAHWGRWYCTCFLWPACLFTAHVGSGSSPLSCGVFLPLPLSQAFPLLVAGRMPLLPLELLQPGPSCLFTFLGSNPLPPLVLRVPHPLCNVSLFSYCLLFSFSFFSGSIQGAMLILPRVVCGSTAYHVAHLVFPSCLGTGDWWPMGPPGFSI
jgi:hypothetical protein